MLARVVKPTKNRVLSLISNRYASHALVIILIVIVTISNVNTREVRAETFGQQSILYTLVVQDDSQTVEIVAAGDRIVSLGRSTSYLSDTGIDARAHIDLDFLEEVYVSPTPSSQSTPEKDVPKRNETEAYVVQEGDTLGQIAEKFGLNLSTVLWANSLTFRSTIQPGDTLDILPIDGVLYTVRSGDTLSRIANKYDVDSDEVMDYNNIPSADRLRVGANILLPGGEPQATATPTRRTPSVVNLFVPQPKAVTGEWVWPTDWHVITQYYGWKHTGLDIDGDYSTNSYAAKGGVVTFVGWRGGYGLTVEIDHGNGIMTRYAHHSKNYVKKGDVVSTGQAIAQTGTTGRSTGTHLHFEIIKGGRFLNPLDYVR